VLEELDPASGRKLQESYRGFAEAAAVRAQLEAAEPGVRRFEGMNPPETGDSRALKAAIQGLKDAVTAARESYVRVSSMETAALAQFREVVAALAARGRNGNSPLALGALPDVEEWARLRGLELEWMDGVIQHSNQILQQPPNSPWERFRVLLGLRRGCCERAASTRRDYQALERRPRPAAPAAPPPAGENPGPRTAEEPVVEIIDPPADSGPADPRGPDEAEAELSVLAQVFADRLDEVRRKLRSRNRRLETEHQAAVAEERKARKALDQRLAESEAKIENLKLEAGRAAEAANAERDKARAAVTAREAEVSDLRHRLELTEQALERIRSAYRAIEGALASIRATDVPGTPGH
jgi:hypothetical protein